MPETAKSYVDVGCSKGTVIIVNGDGIVILINRTTYHL